MSRERVNFWVRPVFACLITMVAGCFSPETDGMPPMGETSTSEPVHNTDACVDEADPCTVNGDCCGFDEGGRIGADLCVDDGYGSACSPTCLSDDDCRSGCCAQLDGIGGYGFCSRPAGCDDGWGFDPPDASCLQGVDFTCECAEDTDSPCDAQTRADFVSTCTDEGSELFDAFRCIDAMSGEGCVDSLEACVPAGAIVRPGSRLSTTPGDAPAATSHFGFATAQMRF